MIQGENKQDFYDYNRPEEIRKRELARIKKIRASQLIKPEAAIRKLTRYIPEEKLKTPLIREAIKTERELIEHKNLMVRPTKEYTKLLNRYKIKEIGREAYAKVPGMAEKVASGFKKVSKFLIGEAKAQTQQYNQAQKADFARRMAHYRRQKAIAKLRQQYRLQRLLMQKKQQSRGQIRLNPQQLQLMQQRRRFFIQQQQAAIAEAKRKDLERTTTYGFYQPDAEKVNPYHLRSRYKINFAQNVFTEKDPANHVVKINGKYKWKVD